MEAKELCPCQQCAGKIKRENTTPGRSSKNETRV